MIVVKLYPPNGVALEVAVANEWDYVALRNLFASTATIVEAKLVVCELKGEAK